jgi:LPS-assembly protein
MTLDIARLLVRRVRFPALLAATMVFPALVPPSFAQDTNPGDCAVNEKNVNGACKPVNSPGAAPAADNLVLDWTPIDSVPTDRITIDCELCGGMYMDPLEFEDRSQDPDDADIRAWAGRTELQGDNIFLFGGVDITQGYRRFVGETAVIDREHNTATLTGGVSLREPGLLLEGDSAVIYSDTGEATVEAGEFVLHEDHLRGGAVRMERDTEGLIHLHDGVFTFCPPGNHDWDIRADTIDLDIDEGLGVARHATVNVGDIPVFYTPWLQFPLDDRRRTGLLWPDFGNDSSGGLDITAPVYFNLAPNYDALYSPRYIEERGLNNELKLRYLNKYAGMWTVGGTYMAHDDRYQNEQPEGRSDDRWLGVVRQDGLIDQRWRSQIDYSKASDVDYMRDLETSSLNAQRKTSLLQLGALDYLGDDWLVGLEVLQFQSLADDIEDVYKKLPQLTAQYRGKGTPFQLEPILLAQYSNFDADVNVVTGQRVYAEAGAAYPMQWAYGFLKPELKFRQLNYDLSGAQFFTNNSPETGAPLASMDGGLFFERDASFGDSKLLQTLEPRVYYLYSGYENQTDQPDFDSAELTFQYNQLFRETRFSGHDRIDDANQISAGLTTRFIDAESGNQLLSASVGQIFYFRDRKVRLNPLAPPLDESGSEIAGELNFTPVKQVSLRTSMVWDPYSGNMNSGNFQASYMPDNGMILNAGYAYRRPLTLVNSQPETEQANFSAYFPITKNWKLFGAVNYSIIDNESIEDMAGVEYDNCCWTIRMLHLRYYNNKTTDFFPDFSNPDLKQEQSTQLQIAFKGMGGFGDRITNILEDMIRGYQEREY